jgi:hypothetical protein
MILIPVAFDIICRRSFGIIGRSCHDVFPAGQSTNRADIAEILTKPIKTLTDGARIGLKIRVSSSLKGTRAHLLRQITAKHLRQIATKATVYSRRKTRLSRQDNRSLGPANTRQHISSIFLLSRKPGFDVHLNGAAQNSRSARAT